MHVADEGEPGLLLEGPLSHGHHFDVWCGRWHGRRVCVKHVAREPRPEGPRKVFGAHWSTSVRRLVSVLGQSGFPVDDAPLEELLAAEAGRIGASRGAWHHEALSLLEHPDRGLCLLTPRHAGVPLDRLDRGHARRLLPRLLPGLWDALAALPHGDVSASNLVVDLEGRDFALVDPCATVSRLLRSRDTDLELRLLFTTTPGAYPLLPPWYAARLCLAEGHELAEHVEDFLRGLTMTQRPGNGRNVPSAVAISPSRPRLGVKSGTREPHPADLLALGVLYFGILTGTHPFLDPRDPRPCWLGGRTEDERAIGFEEARRLSAEPAPVPSRVAADVTPAEDRLARALLALAVPSRTALERLALAAGDAGG